MYRTPVESHMFNSVAYDPKTKTLELEFKNGSVYQYAEFTPADWEALRTAKSKGNHFGRFVRGKFASKKIEPVEKPVGNVENSLAGEA